MDAWTTAAEVYDGDVVVHPVSGVTVTIVMMMQLRPMVMISVPGIVEFDPLDNASINAIDVVEEDELSLEPDDAIYRRWRYAQGERRS